MNYEIKIAHYPFVCPVTGKIVSKGQNYVELEGMALSLDVLPKRKLKPISHGNK